MLKAADRRWWAQLGAESWAPVVGMTDMMLSLGNGKDVPWRLPGTWLPDPNIRLEYTCPVGGTWMPRRPGDFVLLALDFGLRQVVEKMREAINANRE
ncbi:MAG TPA: hypothetical protein VNA25_30305 [Phycisphaerae bacterium]|nr:hypothetical protein [Phycisphaerae bacterium]